MENKPSQSTDTAEIEKFSAMAEGWWDENGKFKPLHKLNPIRLKYIIDNIKKEFCINSLEGLKILDIGCGGGLLCEPLAKLGAKVYGIDESQKTIEVAKFHAQKSGLTINYNVSSVEELATQKPAYFDVILNMEVIEHVADTKSFMESACKLLKKDGLIFNATINRNIKSFLFAIVGAEYVMRWLPINTHSFKKFVKPSQFATLIEQNGCEIKDMIGIEYNILKDVFFVSKNLKVNYIILAKKTK